MRSNLNADQQRDWHEWYENPRGGDRHLTSAGSRARAVSFAKPRRMRKAEVDELYERMVKRGVIARER